MTLPDNDADRRNYDRAKLGERWGVIQILIAAAIIIAEPSNRP